MWFRKWFGWIRRGLRGPRSAAAGGLTLRDFMSAMGRVSTVPPWVFAWSVGGSRDSDAEILRVMRLMRAVYDSMTEAERRSPDGLNPSRCWRIAAGAGVGVADVSGFVEQFAASIRAAK